MDLALTANRSLRGAGLVLAATLVASPAFAEPPPQTGPPEATNIATNIEPGARREIVHAGILHEAHVSPPALAIAPDGAAFVAWVEQDGAERHVLVSRVEDGAPPAARVDPLGTRPDRAHQSPGLAVAPDGSVLVSWSSEKAKPEGVLFANDLRLSVSRDGGRSFDAPLRVNEDRPLSHSFEGLGVTPGGDVLVAWIDSREGWEKAGTYAAWIDATGQRVASRTTVGGDTCVCCRVAVATRPEGGAALAWRQVFPGNVRDVVARFVAPGEHGGAAPLRVARDGWSLDACPHRGPALAAGAGGRIHAAWYTEGRDGRPRIEVTRCSAGGCSEPPLELSGPPDTVPDHVAVAATADGRVLVAFEAFTAVRRQIVARASADGGVRFGPPVVLSRATKAGEPALAVAPSGDLVVAWREERFPRAVTVVQTVRVAAEGAPAADP
jgi:hypothetical protein